MSGPVPEIKSFCVELMVWTQMRIQNVTMLTEIFCAFHNLKFDWAMVEIGMEPAHGIRKHSAIYRISSTRFLACGF